MLPTALSIDGESSPQFLCGLELRTYNGDPATAQVHGSLDYPRVLVAGSADPDGDGNSEPRVECGDAVECVQRCKFLARTSANGAGTPPTCSLCDAYCPNNVLSTITSTVDALFADIMTAVRLTYLCFGASEDQIEGLSDIGQIAARPIMCVCQLIKMLAPEWRKQSKDPDVRCEGKDPLFYIMDQAVEEAMEGAQRLVDRFAGRRRATINGGLNWHGQTSSSTPSTSSRSRRSKPRSTSTFDTPCLPSAARRDESSKALSRARHRLQRDGYDPRAECEARVQQRAAAVAVLLRARRHDLQE